MTTEYQVQDLLKRADDIAYQQVVEKTNAIFNALGEPIKGKFPAHLFKEQFLPFFSGQVQMTPDNDFIAHWITIAGSASSEVELLGADGRVVAVVPPIVDTSIISAEANVDTKEFSDITAESEMLSGQSPVLAKNYFYRELSRKGETLIDNNTSEVLNAREQAWHDLMGYFGVQLPGSSTHDKEKPVEGLSVDDELIYD